jgi:hypothetical protein
MKADIFLNPLQANCLKHATDQVGVAVTLETCLLFTVSHNGVAYCVDLLSRSR